MGSYYFALAGVVFNPYARYDLHQILKDALSRPGSFESGIQHFERRAISERNDASWPSVADFNRLQILIIDSKHSRVITRERLFEFETAGYLAMGLQLGGAS